MNSQTLLNESTADFYGSVAQRSITLKLRQIFCLRKIMQINFLSSTCGEWWEWIILLCLIFLFYLHGFFLGKKYQKSKDKFLLGDKQLK